jgi:hypothetical protein
VGVFVCVGTHAHKSSTKKIFSPEIFLQEIRLVYLCMSMTDDFKLSDDFQDFVDELTSDEKNDNAQCSIDNPDCENCGS